MGIIKKNLKGVILLDILKSTKKMKNFFMHLVVQEIIFII